MLPPILLVEGGWKSVPLIQFVKMDEDNLSTKNVSSCKLAKKVALSLYMASLPFWGMARVPVPSTPSSGLVPSTELVYVL